VLYRLPADAFLSLVPFNAKVAMQAYATRQYPTSDATLEQLRGDRRWRHFKRQLVARAKGTVT
jgi:hypothetical protein